MQRDIYTRTGINTFSNLRQHELVFQCMTLFPHHFTVGHQQRSSPLLREGVRGDCESLPSLVVCHYWLWFPKAEGEVDYCFLSLSNQKGCGKKKSLQLHQVQLPTHSDSLNTRNTLYTNGNYSSYVQLVLFCFISLFLKLFCLAWITCNS